MPRSGARRGIRHGPRLWLPEVSGLTGTVLFPGLNLGAARTLEPFPDLVARGDMSPAQAAVQPVERLGQRSICRF